VEARKTKRSSVGRQPGDREIGRARRHHDCRDAGVSELEKWRLIGKASGTA
jgi:hypothetical protein